LVLSTLCSCRFQILQLFRDGRRVPDRSNSRRKKCRKRQGSTSLTGHAVARERFTRCVIAWTRCDPDVLIFICTSSSFPKLVIEIQYNRNFVLEQSRAFSDPLHRIFRVSPLKTVVFLSSSGIDEILQLITPTYRRNNPSCSIVYRPYINMPGAKRRALKKLLSPHSGPKESHHQSFPTGTEHSNVDPIAVPTLSHSPGQSGDGLSSTTTSLRDLSVSPLPSAAGDQRPVELQMVDEMQNREHVIGSGHAGLAASPSNSLSPQANAAPSGGYTVDDLLNAGTDAQGKKKSSKQRFLEREVSRQ
jgi:hypothetical protein